jgi:hypothetical protein
MRAHRVLYPEASASHNFTADRTSEMAAGAGSGRIELP